MSDRTQLVIVLDSSTDNSANEVGPSMCAWAVFLYEPSKDQHPTNTKLSEDDRYETAVLMKGLEIPPERFGTIYNIEDTPNKIFYDGVLRSLESCYYLVKKYAVTEVIVAGDCTAVLDQMTGKSKAQAPAIKALFKQVKRVMEDYERAGVKFRFEYVSEKNYALYRDIDAIAKATRGQVREKLGAKKQ